MKGGGRLGYKVKRGAKGTGSTVKEMVLEFSKKILAMLIILVLMAVVGYFLFQFAYDRYPVFAGAADDVIGGVKSFYSKHGIWATLGMIVLVCVGVWAIGEEARKKERRKEAMNEMMK